MRNRAYIAPNETGPTEVIFIDEERCIGCNACANICRTQTILKNPVAGKAPLLVYPDECWFCACCVEACPTGALKMRQPIGRRILFKRKETGEVFRIGQKDAPAKSFFRPPYGELQEGKLSVLWVALNHKVKENVAILSEDTCAEVAKAFRIEVCPGKVVALLQYIGFDLVLNADALEGIPAEVKEKYTFFSFSPAAGRGADVGELSFTAADLVKVIKRACVSMYTAVHIWKTMPELPYDSLLY